MELRPIAEKDASRAIVQPVPTCRIPNRKGEIDARLSLRLSAPQTAEAAIAPCIVWRGVVAQGKAFVGSVV
ncbi:MAG TPA: hypothetical protein VJ783_26890 [Pirellulales bacterium]|nr:hypothetical protein [Pirellulales bacterium]